MKLRKKPNGALFFETDEQKSYRMLAYANFQFLCVHRDALANQRLNSLFLELLEFFFKRERIMGKSDTHKETILKAIELFGIPYELISAPTCIEDVLIFEKSFQEKKALLTIRT